MWFFTRKNASTWGHITQFKTSLRLMLITMRGVACAGKGDLMPSFPKWECHVDTIRLFSDEWYHIAFESWVRCMYHFEHNWFELWKKLVTSLSRVCWTDGFLRMTLVVVIVFLLIIVMWCLLIFYNKLDHPCNFVSCDWYLWWPQTFVCGSRWATIGNVGAAKSTW